MLGGPKLLILSMCWPMHVLRPSLHQYAPEERGKKQEPSSSPSGSDSSNSSSSTSEDEKDKEDCAKKKEPCPIAPKARALPNATDKKLAREARALRSPLAKPSRPSLSSWQIDTAVDSEEGHSKVSKRKKPTRGNLAICLRACVPCICMYLNLRARANIRYS